MTRAKKALRAYLDRMARDPEEWNRRDVVVAIIIGALPALLIW